MRILSLAVFGAAFGAILCLAGSAQAQRYQQGGGRIVFFDDVGFRGDQRVVDSDVRDFRDLRFNDRVSSIQVQSGVWEVCEDADFRGRCLTVSRDNPSLVRDGFNDRISSARQVSDNRSDNRYGDRNSDGGRFGNRPRGGRDGGITLFVDDGFRGDTRDVSDSVPDLRALGFNDVTSSIRVTSGIWELCEDIGFRGRCIRADRDIGSLQDQRFNDRISSLRRVN